MNFKDFVLQNWKVLVLAGLVILDIITNLCKKKVKVIDVMSIILTRLPQYVLDAEGSGKSGQERYTMVFSRVVKDLIELTGLSAEEVCSKYSVRIDDAIENNVKVLNNFKEGEKDEKI